MKLTARTLSFGVISILILGASLVHGQVNSLAHRITPSSGFAAFTEDMSGDGRFVVFASQGNLNTVPGTRNNVDGNYELFLMDYAQRHVFQITNTKGYWANPLGSPNEPGNIKVQIFNLDAKISNDGKWLVLTSNATTSTPGSTNGTNPGNFDANNYTTGSTNPLTSDGNMEVWLYKLPPFPAADLSSGISPAFVDLSTGTFTQVTNTLARVLPFESSPSFDSRSTTINDNGCVIAFESVQDLVDGSNIDHNAEIFVHERTEPSVCLNLPGTAQVTRTPANITNLIHSGSPSISGNGRRLILASTGQNPIQGMTGGNNGDFNGEVFVTDIADDGSPTGTKEQLTKTSETNPTIVLNILTVGGRRLSRDGRFITLQSRAQLNLPLGGTTKSTYAVFLGDLDAPEAQRFVQVGGRPEDDPALGLVNPDTITQPTFSDYDVNGQATRLLFTSRMNLRPNGTIPTTNPAEGLNPNPIRQGQIYSYQIGSSPASFSRLTDPATTDYAACFTSSGFALCGRPVVVSNSSKRLAYQQQWNGNFNDRFFYAAVYLLTPPVTTVVASSDFTLSYTTGGSSMTVGTTQPDALGLAPDMLGSATLVSTYTPSVPTTSATGVSLSRNFPAPLELRGASIVIDGFAAKLTANVNGRIDFIVPSDVSAGIKTIKINHNGVLFSGTVNIINAQPDILTSQTCPCPPSSRARLLNITNPAAPQSEPFSVMTLTPSGLVPTKLRVFVTGVRGVLAGAVTIRIGQVFVSSILTNAVPTDYPGVYSFDFMLPQQLAGAGDVPIVMTVTVGGQPYQSRPDSTAPRLHILSNDVVATDLAVWRPSNGGWYVMSGNGGIQATMQWGLPTDKPAPGDFDGDGKTDFSVFRPTDGVWYVVTSSNNSFTATYFGTNGDQVAQADYDGDGKTDVAVFRPSTSYWYIIKSTSGQLVSLQFGLSTDTVVPADYDGDGSADIAIWRSSDHAFWIKQSSDNQVIGTSFGEAGDRPVVGDYDGDGKSDYATWRGGSDNSWRILQSSNSQVKTVQWGIQGTDIAVQGDYDVDGKTDIAVWRSAGADVGWWYIRKSRDEQMRAEQWGLVNDIPVPAPYRRY